MKSSVFALHSTKLIRSDDEFVCLKRRGRARARDSNVIRLLLCVDAVLWYRIVYDNLFFLYSCHVSFTERTTWNSCEGIPFHFNCMIIGLIFFFFISLMCLRRYHTKLNEQHFCYKTSTSLSSGIVHHVFRVDHIASVLHESRIRHFNLFICLHTSVVRQRFVFFVSSVARKRGEKKKQWKINELTSQSSVGHCMYLISVPVTRFVGQQRTSSPYTINWSHSTIFLRNVLEDAGRLTCLLYTLAIAVVHYFIFCIFVLV